MAKTPIRMTRPKLEKAIIAALSLLLKEEYIVPLQPDLNKSSMAGRFYTFSKVVNDSTIKISLRFFGKFDLCMEAEFLVYSKQVALFLVANGMAKNHTKKFPVVGFDMESFFANDHGDPINLQKGNRLDSIPIDRTAKFIFERYFVYARKKLIPRMNTVQSLEAVLNDPARFNENGPDFLYITPRQIRIMAGTSLALICKKRGYKTVLKKYKKAIHNYYEPKQYKTIDLCSKVIEAALA